MATISDEGGGFVAADIFQILLAAPESFASPPEAVARNIKLTREAHPGARHHLLNEDDLRSLIGAHFDGEVMAAFDTLKPNAERSNLGRYCALLVHGGLYVDIGVRMVAPLRGPPGAALVAFRDYWGSTTRGGAIIPGLCLAKAGRAEFKTAIDMVTANVRARYYGVNPIEVSGPALFARAIAAENDVEHCWFGQYLAVAAETKLKNFVFLTPDGEIVALGKTGAGGDLSYLGLAGVNNYVEMWRARQVYGETGREWRGDSAQLLSQIGRREVGALHYSAGASGFVLYGPYCPLPAGLYRAVLRFAPRSTVARCAFDVAFAAGVEPTARVAFGEAQLEDDKLTLDFELAAPQTDVECRMWSEGADEGALVGLAFAPR